ncbi:probable inactive leucine-rich repeat receptor-like protein kinase At3g03770 isoform X2 [Cajanus cajan]|nr:probable inactive leucine-rich repeat receptor-like protein kinase At3g03770 isoform X2 [Cajanus cajan]
MLKVCSMRYFYLYLVVLTWFLSIPSTHELQLAQTQVLLQLRKYLEYPTSLLMLENYYGDLCSLPASANVAIKCEGNSVIELKIMGDRVVKVDKFNGYAVPNKTLSVSFSIDSFVTTLTRLTNLRVLRLVSLGIWGPLPDKIHRLSLLQVLDLSSNFLYGSVPPRVSTMVKLHTLTLDGNYLNSTMPDWLGSLSNLNVLSLKSNHLKGSFPSSLCKISSLADISLSHNNLSGALPDLTALSSLHVLDLRENHLDSELPLMPKAVVTILLSKNSFSGEIPNQFGELDQLQHLDLSSNHLSRMPPNALFSLPNISYLNLASNELSGPLPHDLKCGSKLGFVDISSNKLKGELSSCLIRTSGRIVVKYGGNCLSVDSQPQRRGTYCKESSSGRKNFLNWKIAAAVAMIIVIILVLSALGVLFYRKYHSREMYNRHEMLLKAVQDNSTTGVSSELLASARFISQVAKLGTQATPTCRQFSIEELKEVTRNFDLSTYIGEGSLGKMYKGKLENGSYVAIRCLALSKKCSMQNLKARLDLLSKLHHPNLVSLLGHCIDGDGQDDSSGLKLHLVYEYVPYGNYHTYMSEKALKWSERLAILIGVAKAVHFLHTGVIPGCFRNQLKAHNVLLDEHHIPKLSDYGMSMISEEIEYLEVKGENPKSCQREKLEDDVYNFGLISFESLVGPIASEKGVEFFLHDKVSFDSQDGRNKIVDPVVLNTCCPESLSIAISITTKCLSPESSSPPSFEDVLWNLQYAAQVQAIADADQKSDSTTS